MNIGVIIKKYRKEVGMTQEEMANRLGVTKTNGRRVIPSRILNC